MVLPLMHFQKPFYIHCSISKNMDWLIWERFSDDTVKIIACWKLMEPSVQIRYKAAIALITVPPIKTRGTVRPLVVLRLASLLSFVHVSFHSSGVFSPGVWVQQIGLLELRPGHSEGQQVSLWPLNPRRISSEEIYLLMYLMNVDSIIFHLA